MHQAPDTLLVHQLLVAADLPLLYHQNRSLPPRAAAVAAAVTTPWLDHGYIQVALKILMLMKTGGVKTLLPSLEPSLRRSNLLIDQQRSTCVT